MIKPGIIVTGVTGTFGNVAVIELLNASYLVHGCGPPEG